MGEKPPFVLEMPKWGFLVAIGSPSHRSVYFKVTAAKWKGSTLHNMIIALCTEKSLPNSDAKTIIMTGSRGKQSNLAKAPDLRGCPN